MTLGLVRIRIVEDLKEAQAKQKCSDKFIACWNERSRIGQDDSLQGIPCYAECQDRFSPAVISDAGLSTGGEGIKRNPPDQQGFHEWSANYCGKSEITDLASELETVKKMLEIAGIEVEVDNQLDKASLTQDVESTAMILLELATNIIKHASAEKAYLNWTHRSGIAIDIR